MRTPAFGNDAERHFRHFDPLAMIFADICVVLHLSCATLSDMHSFAKTVLLPNTDGLLAYDFDI